MISKFLDICSILLNRIKFLFADLIEDLYYFIRDNIPNNVVELCFLVIVPIICIPLFTLNTLHFKSYLMYSVIILLLFIWFMFAMFINSIIRIVVGRIICFTETVIESWFLSSNKSKVIFSIFELIFCLIAFIVLMFNPMIAIEDILIFGVVTLINYLAIVMGIRLVDEEGEETNEIFKD